MPEKAIFANAKEIRQRAGLTKTSLQKLANVSAGTLTKLEGKYPCRFDIVVRVFDELKSEYKKKTNKELVFSNEVKSFD